MLTSRQNYSRVVFSDDYVVLTDVNIHLSDNIVDLSGLCVYLSDIMSTCQTKSCYLYCINWAITHFIDLFTNK